MVLPGVDEHAHRFAELLEAGRFVEHLVAAGRRELDALAGQPDGRRQQARPRQGPEPITSGGQTGDDRGDGDRARALAADLAVVSCHRRARGKIHQPGRTAVGVVIDQVATISADAGPPDVRDGRRQDGRDRGIDGVAASLQDVDADFSGCGVLGGNDRVLGSHPAVGGQGEHHLLRCATATLSASSAACSVRSTSASVWLNIT